VRRRYLWAVAILVCAAMQGVAQQAHPSGFPRFVHEHQGPTVKDAPKPDTVLDATGLGMPLLLDKNWRVGVTSDIAAGKPDFDDTKWSVRDASASIADVSGADEEGDIGNASEQRYAWFRRHIKLAPNHGPVALLIQLPVSQNTPMSGAESGPGADVYANGKHIVPEGPHPDATYRYQEISRIYNLEVPATETSLTLVVKTLYIPFGFTAYTNFFATRSFWLGSPVELNRTLELWSVHNLFERLPRLIISILLLVLAVFLLTLYFTQKGHTEYLWLALHELMQAPIGFVELAGSSARLDQLWFAAIILQLVALSAYVYFEFLIAFLSLRRRWYISTLRYTSPVLLGVGPALLLFGHNKLLSLVLFLVFGLGSLLWLLGWTLFIFLTLIVATIKRNFEAGMLLIPLVLTIIGIIEPIVTGGIADFGGGTFHSPLTFQAGPIPIHFAAIADFTSMMAIIIIIFGRFLRIHHEQERASSELAAARSVQELMIPREKVETPGFEVDSVYNPATEVGGDFFHVESTEDGGLLVVIGDVAGKGLQAAMNVSMLMGALRRTPDRSPATILESLNRVLLGSESFTTCQAAWFGANGELVLANAGHLPPYLNSQEVKVPGALPLGVMSDVKYDEVRLYLHPGDRLLMMSDGVVEARMQTGELFGFNRIHNLSNQSAFYIADAAKAFGQEDDITVLTVRRLAQAVAA
jgi:sigma-B regulation protein RsbU (phosphoserine phosphatase)